jgi:peptidoglycan-associated lipoprotein
MLTLRRVLVLGLGTVIVSAGCRKAAPETQPSTNPAPSQPPATNPGPSGTTAPPTGGGSNNSALEAARATLADAVYFEYDQDALSAEAQALLDRKLGVLTANPGVQLRVVGHADERGSDEYNLALGQRRASTVKRYLTDRGLPEARLEIVSMGEERPACTTAMDESCFRQNRRANFEITGGSITTAAR